MSFAADFDLDAARKMMDPPIQVELTGRALVKVEGPDARSFLQGLLTQDMVSQADGSLSYAALLSPQGRLLLDLFVLATPEGFVLDVAADRRDDLIRRLTLYRLRAKVTLAPLDGRVFVLMGTQVPRAGWHPDPRLAAMGLRGYDVAPSADAVSGQLSDYAARRIALSVPDMADFGDDATYPIEANLDLLQAIDFRKGCFVGQETTSRMKRRGQIKSRMLPIISLDGPLHPAAEVLNGELRAGEVRSTEGSSGLALMRLDRLDGPLTVQGRPVRVHKPDWISSPGR